MNAVSSCCHRGIVAGHRKEFPLGGSTWYQTYKVDICDCCGMEVEEIAYACGICGVVGCSGSCEKVGVK
jgi:hypothetical protein